MPPPNNPSGSGCLSYVLTWIIVLCSLVYVGIELAKATTEISDAVRHCTMIDERRAGFQHLIDQVRNAILPNLSTAVSDHHHKYCAVYKDLTENEQKSKPKFSREAAQTWLENYIPKLEESINDLKSLRSMSNNASKVIESGQGHLDDAGREASCENKDAMELVFRTLCYNWWFIASGFSSEPHHSRPPSHGELASQASDLRAELGRLLNLWSTLEERYKFAKKRAEAAVNSLKSDNQHPDQNVGDFHDVTIKRFDNQSDWQVLKKWTALVPSCTGRP